MTCLEKGKSPVVQVNQLLMKGSEQGARPAGALGGVACVAKKMPPNLAQTYSASASDPRGIAHLKIAKGEKNVG